MNLTGLTCILVGLMTSLVGTPLTGTTQGTSAAPNDTITVTLPADAGALLGSGPRAGRMIVFLVAEGSKAADGQRIIDAPFFDDPQPMYSVAVDAFSPGERVTLGRDAVAFPGPMALLDGNYRAQVVFDRMRSERGHLSPGNLVSDPVMLRFAHDKSESHTLTLTTELKTESRAELDNLKWFEMKSPSLSRAAGRDIVMRAGVALPVGWDDPNTRRRMFPAIYVVPGFGGRATGAETFARMLAFPGNQSLVPQAVWIVLDPETPLGHHGFADSPNNGPWATALVREFIPALERQFRLIPRVNARLITGHSSGGWSSLWLQLRYPDVFGACFSSSPDPVDFSRFQAGDLYADTSIYTDSDGKERPSYRAPLINTIDKVHMTVRDEAGMERVLGPARNSGEQWDSWSAMWSPTDPATKLPRPMFDGETGTIDKSVVKNSWSQYDVTALVRADPKRYAPILLQRVRLLCGARDNYFLDRGVQGLKDALAETVRAAAKADQPFPTGIGYIEIIPNETHDTMGVNSMLRWHREMREYLRIEGLD